MNTVKTLTAAALVSAAPMLAAAEEPIYDPSRATFASDECKKDHIPCAISLLGTWSAEVLLLPPMTIEELDALNPNIKIIDANTIIPEYMWVQVGTG